MFAKFDLYKNPKGLKPLGLLELAVGLEPATC